MSSPTIGAKYCSTVTSRGVLRHYHRLLPSSKKLFLSALPQTGRSTNQEIIPPIKYWSKNSPKRTSLLKIFPPIIYWSKKLQKRKSKIKIFFLLYIFCSKESQKRTSTSKNIFSSFYLGHKGKQSFAFQDY